MERFRATTWTGRAKVCSRRGRPNPIGLHAVVIETVEENAITIHNLEAIDGTPVQDGKPILGRVNQR